MTISVVIPCRNAGPYLAQAIGSALDQSRPPHEIIVVDDGSSDGTLELALRFEKAEPGRVRVYAERSGRASRTRNLGALVATGHAIMFLDADDVLAPDALEALAEALAHEAAGIAACPWFRMERIAGQWVTRPPSCAPRRPGDDPLAAWLTGWYYPPCAVLWSRAAFEQAGRWDERALVNQDGDLMMRALARRIPLVETSRGTAWYRRLPAGENSVSGARLTRAGLAARLRAIRKTASLLQDLGRIAPYRLALAEAFGRIAADARDRYADLSDAARADARAYGPSRWERATRRAPLRFHDGGLAAQPAGAANPVRCGLDRAGRVLAAAPAPVPAAAVAARAIDRPAVSVIVPTYNRASLLPRAIDSVLAQTWRDFELLVVDDGSTDATPDVVATYADRRIRYLRAPQNAGASAARNRGLRAARAELIAFLDSDDEWMPQKLARQIATFHAAPPDVGLVYTGVESVREDGTTRIECSRARGDVYREMLRENLIHGGGSNVMIRREVVATAGFFNEALAAIEDYDYWLRVTRFFHVEVVEEPLIRYYDMQGPERRSLGLHANLEARWWFYRTHAAEMRHAGVAHLFLLKSVRRALKARPPDLRAARRLAARALLEAPTSRAAIATFGRTMFRRA